MENKVVNLLKNNNYGSRLPKWEIIKLCYMCDD
jgi:hypothetical protein